MICTIRLMIAGKFLEVKMMDLDQRVMVISGRVLIGSPIRALEMVPIYLEANYHPGYREYQSFTDLVFSKDKRLTCIDWHPKIKGKMSGFRRPDPYIDFRYHCRILRSTSIFI